MNTQLLQKALHLSERELLFIAKKVGKLATFCEQVKDETSFIRVESEWRETKKKQDEVKVMVTVCLPRATFRAESRRSKVMEAADRAIKKLTPQLKRYKEMHTGRQTAHRLARRG